MPPLRFVVLWHDGIPEPHYDLMVETLPGSPLTTWRIPAWPVEQRVVATRLKDHRREFLDYEGELTQRRGTVSRVAAGMCAVTVGENSVWGIQALPPAVPWRLSARLIEGDRWEIDLTTHSIAHGTSS